MDTNVENWPREIGRNIQGDGPLLIAFGSMHGNEPAGSRAIRRILARLDDLDTKLRGGIIGLVGNRAALAKGERFIDEDLNRIWTREHLQDLHATENPTAEQHEQREILDALQEVLFGMDHPVFVLDLHSTSGPGLPFGIVIDSLRNRAFAQHFPIPFILGMEEHMHGAMIFHLDNLGTVNVAVEGGQHDDPNTAACLEAVLWIALAAAGCVDTSDVPDLDGCRRVLAESSKDLPRFMDVRKRHAIAPEHEFVMEPGWENFQHVDPGDLLARDRDGEIRADQTGRMLFPLYQGLGDDGFFIARDVRPFWLKLSAVLRRMRLGVLLPWLPGMRRDPDREDLVHVHRAWSLVRIAGIFHLMGYRQHPDVGQKRLAFVRRKNDLNLLGF